MDFNFNKYREITFDVTVNGPAANGQQDEELNLHIVTPSLSVYEDLSSRASRAASKGNGSNLELIKEICCDILNLNREGVTFTPDDVAELPGTAVSEFVTAYFTWLPELRAEKN